MVKLIDLRRRMKRVTATDAKTNLGELLGSLAGGPVEITRNGRPVAILRAPESPNRPPVTDPARIAQLVRNYAAGAIGRRDLQEQTGLAFGEILERLAGL